MAELTRAEAEEGTSLWQDAWKRLRKNRMAVVGGCVLAAIAVLCVVGPWLSPFAFDAQNLAYGARPPTWAHPFGTDSLGRDLFVRVTAGGRLSFTLGIAATLVAFVIGVVYGAISGYAGGRVDSVMMRIVDVLYTIPFMFLVILLMVFFGRNLVLMFVALGAVSWLTMARIVRAQVLSLKHMDFVMAARAVGASPGSIVFRHLIPNTLGPVIVYVTLTVPRIMLEEAFLSFLGLGVQPPNASWGLLVSDGAASMLLAPWQLAFPGALLAATLFSLNFIGDGLRDALDPRMK